MKKETAVEWLLKRFEDGDMYNVEDVQFIKHQAKAMHKEEIRNAYDKGEFNQGCNGDSEQYYNETYEK